MAILLELPDELLIKICGFMSPRSSDHPRHLVKVARTCRQLREVAYEVLYKMPFPRTEHEMAGFGLMLFMRTLIERPDLAKLVEKLVVELHTKLTFHDRFIFAAHRKVFKEAAQAWGLRLPDWVGPPFTHEWPFEQLLFFLTPSLVEMQVYPSFGDPARLFEVWRIHSGDLLLQAGYALNAGEGHLSHQQLPKRPPPLSCLKRLTCGPDLLWHPGMNRYLETACKYMPLAPNLEHLVLHNLNGEMPVNVPTMSKLVKLEFHNCYFRPAPCQRLIENFPNLESFANFEVDEHRNFWSSSPETFWACLKSTEATLKSLKIDRRLNVGDTEPWYGADPTTLKRFTALQSLDISLKLFRAIGFDPTGKTGPRTPEMLVDVLPPSLEILLIGGDLQPLFGSFDQAENKTEAVDRARYERQQLLKNSGPGKRFPELRTIRFVFRTHSVGPLTKELD